MAYPMGSAPLAIGERVEQFDEAVPLGPTRLPLSTADGPAGGDAAGLVRSLFWATTSTRRPGGAAATPATAPPRRRW